MERPRQDDFESALDRSVRAIQSGQAAVEQCLALYPDHAAELRPLLELARDLGQVPLPVARPEARAAGRLRMLEAVAAQARARQPRTAITLKSRPRWAGWPSRAFGLAFATVAALLAMFLGWGAWQATAVARTATLAQVQGDVQVQPANAASWQSAGTGMVIAVGDRLRTGESSAATVRFMDGSTTELGASTELSAVSLQSRRDGRNRIVTLYQQSGETYHQVRPSANASSVFEVATASAVARVRGTEFTVRVGEDHVTTVSVTTGLVAVTAHEVTRQVTAGEMTTVEAGQPPAQPSHTPQRPSETPQPSHTPQRPSDTPQPSHTPQRPSETPQPSHTPQRPSDTPQPSHTSQRPSQTPQPSHTSQRPTETPQPSHTPQRPSETPQGPSETPRPTETGRPSETPRPSQTSQQPSETPQGPSETPRPSQTSQQPSETPRPSHTPPQPSETPRPSQTSQQPGETPQGPSETPRPNHTPPQPSETPQPSQTLQQPSETPQGPSETPRPSHTPPQPSETPQPSQTLQQPSETPQGPSGTPQPTHTPVRPTETPRPSETGQPGLTSQPVPPTRTPQPTHTPRW